MRVERFGERRRLRSRPAVTTDRDNRSEGLHGLMRLGLSNPNVASFWALDNHWTGQSQTEIGKLVFASKNYGDSAGEPNAAKRLAGCLAFWVGRLQTWEPSLGAATMVVPIPTDRDPVPHNLPDVLAAAAATELGIPLDTEVLRYSRAHDPVKRTHPSVRQAALIDAFMTSRRLDGATVILVDDLVQTGATLGSGAAALRAGGAETVVGIAASYVRRGMQPRRS